MIKYFQSRYCIRIPLKSTNTLMYNSLSGAFAILDKQDMALFETIEEGRYLDATDQEVKQMELGGFIRREQVDELTHLEQQYKAHRFDPNTMILTIAPTLACNFGCDYCFQGIDKAKDTMSREVQDAIVALVERAAPNIRHLHVAWYGGEPLVRLKIIEALSDRFIELCAQRGIKYDAMIVTNGYQLTRDVALSLHTRRVGGVQITLDGPAEHHDVRRVLLSGKGTYRAIIDNVKTWIDEVPLSVSVRVNIDERNRNDIHKLIDDMEQDGLAGKKNLKMYFAPVEAITTGCHSIADVTMGKLRYGQLETELYQHGYEVGLTALPYPPRFRGICSAVRPKGLVITPNGDLHKCWDTVSFPKQKVGTIFDVEALNEDERVLEWLRWTPFTNQTCRNCKILPNCTGSCAYKFIHHTDTRGEAAVLPCPSWKYNIKERLVHRAEKMGFITAEDYDPADIQTDPNELCTTVLDAGGNDLPSAMKALYQPA
ncbi:radical SAM/SPASM domain protein maturase [Spirosoma taeanense]|uniref:Radical SAM/SPASM domain protein maturase n=1 Tax=Spirosoma taeanense TaxID=2735870 RepID=A0A6M5Y789_9BACT|nr:TIGR04463 family radical SAM/SPASM RiPP maturase [Spirosoma taeanense]QJW89091.1 radical SAM/SPASM domain protein maturase [Spirosoma taeanense]